MTTQTLSPVRLIRTVSAMATFALAAIAVFPVQAETTQCTEIASLPAILSVQGIYCLKHDLATNMTNGNAITIANSNITIDFNGFKLNGLAAGDATGAKGVYALNRRNITLRNGVIRGFMYGVSLDDSDSDLSNTGGHRLYDLVLDNNTYSAAYIEGTGNSISNNRVSSTGGSTLLSSAYALFNAGPSASMSGNIIRTTVAHTNGGSIGIASSGGTAVIRDNEVTDTRFDSGGSGFGIIATGTGSVIENNAILNQAVVAGSQGINTSSSTQNICLNNKIAAFSTAVASCKDGGGNIAF